MKALNISAKVRVKFTPFGVEHYKSVCDSDHLIPEVDEFGFCEMELWRFMNMFGEFLYNGTNDRPLEDGMIYIFEEDLETAQS